MQPTPPHPATASTMSVSVDPVIITADGQPLAMQVSAPMVGTDLPVVVVSHGNLLSRHDYRPLVAMLVAHGYIVIQPDHPDASQNGFPPPAYPADTWLTRLRQITWIGAHVPDVLAAAGLSADRADPAQIVVLGHSFGGQTAALAMGAQVRSAGQTEKHVFRAGVLLSAPGNADGLNDRFRPKMPYLDVDWSSMRGPVLMVNGTADVGPMSDNGPGWHDDGFNRARDDADLCLLRVEGAGHYLGGIDSVLRPPAGDATPERRALVFNSIVAFLDHALGRTTGEAARWPTVRSGLACKGPAQ